MTPREEDSSGDSDDGSVTARAGWSAQVPLPRQAVGRAPQGVPPHPSGGRVEHDERLREASASCQVEGGSSDARAEDPLDLGPVLLRHQTESSVGAGHDATVARSRDPHGRGRVLREREREPVQQGGGRVAHDAVVAQIQERGPCIPDVRTTDLRCERVTRPRVRPRRNGRFPGRCRR